MSKEETKWYEKSNVVSQFRRSSFRPYQKETIEEIAGAFEDGYKYVILDAPTGSGKSEIGACFAFASGDAHILTIQKLLQDQYQEDFRDMFIMKGRGSYTCVRGYDGESCAEGPCRLRKSEKCPTCPYGLAKLEALEADVAVHNFDSFYYQNTYGSGMGSRELIIIDEAHNISNKFSSFLSFTIDSRGGVDVPDLDSISEYDSFVRDTYNIMASEYSMLKLAFDGGGLSKYELKRMNDLRATVLKMKRFITMREKADPEEYVFDFTNTGRYGPKVTFRPVFSGAYASRWLSDYGERVLMMSATILDKDMFCRETGLDPEKTYYVNTPSVFPAENRPIVKKFAGSMRYNQIKFTLPRLAEIIQEIVDKYPGRKGIIQTHSERIAKYLYNNLLDTRYTYNKDFPNPQAMLEAHKKKDGSFIIASGLREGLDLRGDLSKVQIFCKVPYPSLGDKLVSRKMEIDSKWYGWMTTLMFVQSLGRSVRSPKERAVTYILDSDFSKFYGMNKRFIPQYIKEALQ